MPKVGVAASLEELALHQEKSYEVSRSTDQSIDLTLWKQVAGYNEVKEQLTKSLIWPLKYPEALDRFYIPPVRGILLHGPPGCAKTTLARTNAKIISASFISLDISDVFCSPYYGESERRVREVFEAARQALPSIVFVDEIDSVLTNRFGSSGKAEDVSKRILATLLNEMDGVTGNDGVIVLGATNRLENIDKALLRPGRFDVKILVPLPNLVSRFLILRLFLGRMPLDDFLEDLFLFSVNDADCLDEKLVEAHIGSTTKLKELLEKTHGFSGADLESLCKKTGLASIRANESVVNFSQLEKQLQSVELDLEY